MRTRRASKFVTHPLGAMVAVCLASVAAALALGTLIPWPFLQNAAEDFVGGLLAGLLIFGLANIAFGFTERREKERHALRIAYRMLLMELSDNHVELSRIVKVLREGSLTRADPVFGRGERLRAENWQLLAQSPLVEYLSPDLFWTIGNSYDVPRRFVRQLKESDSRVLARNPQGWKDLCDKYLELAESAMESVDTAWAALNIAHESMEET